jgi:hypothetical protein
MAWTAPMTAIAGSVFTAAQFNTFIRDNLAETAAAKAQTISGYFVTSDTNQISERIIANGFLGTADTTSSTSYTDLDTTVGPSVTVNTGTGALVMVSARCGPNNTASQSSKMSWQVSGGSSIAPTDNYAAGIGGTVGTFGYVSTQAFHNNLVPGSNTFTAKYTVSGGTGNFSQRRITVMPF